MPPYTTSSAGFSAPSASKLFISMRSGASVIQDLALKVLPRAARMIRGFKGASMVAPLLGAEPPRHFISGTGIVEAGPRGYLSGSPGAPYHEQAGLLALHGQKFAGALIGHHGTQQMLGLLQRCDFDQVVVGSGLVEIHFQIVGRELGKNVAVFELDGPVVFEVHDDRAVQLAAGCDAEILREICDGANALEGHDFGAVHMAPAADLVGDAADFERMRVCLPVGDEAADSGDAHQNAFVAQFAQGPIGRHARHAEGFYDVVFGRYPRRGSPLA